MAREVNLVPDIKDEMIKALKLRNFIFFLSAVVAIASVGVTLFIGLIAGGQKLALDGKKTTIDNLSSKLNSYTDLNEFLTIKDQLGNISALTNNKQVMSRSFDVLSAILPTGPDVINLSELTVDLSGDQPTFHFVAKADAREEPFIDYKVLESFKKSMRYLRYDYGNYVDKDGQTIPAYCIIEKGTDGAVFNDLSKGIYAYWTINREGCKPTSEASETTETSEPSDSSESSEEKSTSTSGYSTEEYEGQQVVRIWRTPQFSDWYKETEQAGKPYMSLDGQISNVPHFQSSCTTYSGDNSQSSSNPKWTSSNESCWLVPAGSDGFTVIEATNGRGSDDDLVLSFTATITFSPEVFKFTNYHMLALAVSGRHNATDSYFQLQSMFSEKAVQCAEGDTTCNAPVDITNTGGEE